MRAAFGLLLLLVAPGPSLAGEMPRFGGTGSLVAGHPVSPDGRYAVRADLVARDELRDGGRFRLVARLVVGDEARAVGTACFAGTDIFGDGFE